MGNDGQSGRVKISHMAARFNPRAVAIRSGLVGPWGSGVVLVPPGGGLSRSRMMDPFGVSSWDREMVVPMRHRRPRSVGERSLHVGPVQGRARGTRRWQWEQCQHSRCWRVPGPRVSRE